MANYLYTFQQGFLGGKTTLPISSKFGMRMHPIYNQWRFHYGIDIAVVQGTQLRAPIRGRVTKRVQRGKAGLYITLAHRNDDGSMLYVLFMHMHSVVDGIMGQEVEPGTLLGTTGGNAADGPDKAGNSRGAHLHLEVRYGSNDSAHAVDPEYFFLANHKLTEFRSGKLISEAQSGTRFTDDKLVTVAVKKGTQKCVPAWDITVESATEFDQPKPKKTEYEGQTKMAPGIWQIVKLLLDSSVENRQIADSSICVQMGSLLNFFQKVCQEPLVEFMGDTFGNNYYYIVRKPPFDKEGYLRMMEMACTDISDEEIISTNIQWNNANIYSWYRFVPYADCLGISEAEYFCPAIFLPEFAAIWGSRPLCVQSNYFNFIDSGYYNSSEQANKENSMRIIRNMVKDFRYIIESNAYNAFSRSGSVTLRGNRKIKRGTLVMFSNGECFHVDGVSQNYSVSTGSVERTTTLQLSKGLFSDFIQGKENINGDFCSYFNIVDFGEYKDEEVTQDNFRKIISGWKVNRNVFQYFLARQQIYKNDKQKTVR